MQIVFIPRRASGFGEGSMGVVRAISRVPLLLLLLVSLLPFSSIVAMPAVAAGPGDLDTTFGTGGKLVTDFEGEERGNSVAIQNDGKIVVSGYSHAGKISDFAMARYNDNGSLDTTFGTGGKLVTDFGGDDGGISMVIRSDGRVVVAGYSNSGGSYDFALARYNGNGSLDTSFGTGGKLTTNFGGSEVGYSVAIQSDGKIVVAGGSNAEGTYDFALARYNDNGSLDTSFGTGGKLTTNFGGSEVGLSVAIQDDGRIVVTGDSSPGGTGDFLLARYNANGSLDTAFGTGGKSATDFGGDDVGLSVAIQDDGRIVVAGVSEAGGTGDFALARYNANGSLDASFGTGGKLVTDFGDYDVGLSVAIQGDGRIVVIGASSAGGWDFALARYSSSGSLDITFGTGGKLVTDFGGHDDGYSVAIQGDGKIVVAGQSGGDFAVARYLAAAPAPTPTPTPVPGVGWPGLLVLAVGLAALGLLSAIRRARVHRAG